ncbi:MAG: glycosyltransferase family 4 protein [Elusimicrobiota bacterium]|jgi:glycosyltransferase involved in cell wall biosynthesis
MKNLVFIAAHLGYPMEKTPLGGGAMVGLQLVRHWPQDGSFKLVVLGSGPEAPVGGVEYVQLPAPGPQAAPIKLSEMEYAAFSRDFERSATEWLLSQKDRLPPDRTCVMVNDVAEGPDVERIKTAGYPLASLWHVDVVDYFNKLYLRSIVRPERLTMLYERSRRLGMRWVIPDMLQIVFEKQRNTVHFSDLMIMPSSTMAATVARCYGYLGKDEDEVRSRIAVIPWGMWEHGVPESASDEAAAALRKHYQVKPETAVLMTLSRIAPEKGLHHLLRALKVLEDDGRIAGRDVCLIMAGEPAFMQGAAYMRQVQADAAALRSVRVFFPGYLAAPEKAAFFKIADIFVSPSVHESYGLNVVEAMQAGMAILASDHYGVRDVVDPSFGRVVHYPSPAKAPERLAGALMELLEDPERLREMGRQAAEAASRMPFKDAAVKVLEAGLALVRGG